ncbi:MAG: polysaccharide biosynthesis tyrosine autokinase [candidate division Zixibacteria bacterium]|nr:polysaccharide biosynthesis tyrosine autokinase [candidate division Zixibacteria bacterium]
MEFRQFLRIIFRYKSMIVLMCLSAMLTATLLTYIMSERYRSSTKVLIRPQKSIEFVPKREEILNFPVSYYTPIETASKTYTEIIKSRIIAERVVTLLGLDRMKEEEGAGLRYIWKKAKKRIKDFVIKGWTLVKYGRIKKEDVFSRAVTKVQTGLSVKPTKETYLFELQAEAGSPQLASAVANAAAEVFLEYLREMKALEKDKEKKLSRDKMIRSKQELEDVRTALVEFKESQGIAALQKEVELELESVSELENSWESINSEIKGAIAKKEEISRKLAEFERFSKSAAKITDNPLIRELHSQLAKKEVKLAGLRELFAPEHRELQALQAEIDEIRTKLEQEAPTLNSEEVLSVNPVYRDLRRDLALTEADLAALRAKNNSLALAIQEKKRLIEQMPQVQADLSKLELAVKLHEETYKLLSREYEELEVAAAREAPDIRVIHSAVTPLYPARPIKVYHAALAGILSLIVGIGIALLMEHMNTRIRSIDEAERGLALPVLMTIPRLDSVQSHSWPLTDGGGKALLVSRERRKYERAYGKLPIEVKRPRDSMFGRGVTTNLSLGGFCCYADRKLDLNPGDHVEISIVLDKASGKRAVAEGVVLRSEGTGGGYHASAVAIQFVKLNRPLVERIKKVTQNGRSPFPWLLPPHFEEPIHGLRFDLQLRNAQEMSSFLVTSCDSQEGKSTIVSNLAVSLAEINKKVVLVDGNLRFPKIHRIFGLPNETGLSSLLRTGALPCAIKDKSGLSFLPSGPPVSDPSALLGSGRMIELLRSLNNVFDFVLIDSPHLLAGPDSGLLASMAHGTIIVLSAGRTSLEDSRRAKQILERVHAKILGIVLNNYDDEAARYYIPS